MSDALWGRSLRHAASWLNTEFSLFLFTAELHLVVNFSSSMRQLDVTGFNPPLDKNQPDQQPCGELKLMFPCDRGASRQVLMKKMFFQMMM